MEITQSNNNQKIIQSEANNKEIDQLQKTVQLGFAIFYDKIRKRENLRAINGKNLSIIEKQIWQFTAFDQRKIKNHQKLFSLIKQTVIKEFHYRKNPQILKQIEPIKFLELKKLNLFCAGIINFEAFSFLNAPKLQIINLIYNNCLNYKSFNKVHMPQMKLICIYVHKIDQIAFHQKRSSSYTIQDFQRWGFEIDELRLQKSNRDSVVIQDLSKLAKCKKSISLNLYLNLINRIRQESVLRTIKQKQETKFYIPNQNGEFQQYQIKE